MAAAHKQERVKVRQTHPITHSQKQTRLGKETANKENNAATPTLSHAREEPSQSKFKGKFKMNGKCKAKGKFKEKGQMTIKP